MQPAFTLPSFAKINWTLRILGKRGDGFHELFTVFQTVSLHDTISFAESDELELTCDDPNIPTDDSNLIIRAAKAIQEICGVTSGARIHLEKNIPSPGGLGGGSSNAAVAILGLTRLWNAWIDDLDLSELTSSLGSDVGFFLMAGTAIGTGRGEIIEPLDDLTEEYLLIVTPQISVSTRDAFGELGAPTLTNEARNHILSVCRTEAGSLDPRSSVLTNDFERTVFSAHPEIENVKNTLLDLGAANAALSGSGASVFAVFEKEETRQAAIKALDLASTWRKFAVSTISRSKYCEALGI